MKQEILTQFPWPWLPTLALMIFVTFFIGLLINVSMKSRRKFFDAAATLPLQDAQKYGENL